MNARSRHIAVVGGGAAGFFGAIACAEANPNLQVTILEAGSECLVKVRISGGGRCNVTHACFDPALLVQHYPRGSKALRGPFSRFQPGDTMAWFEARGVALKTEADGRMFPTTDDSATIVRCLWKAAKVAGMHIRTRTAAIGVSRQGAGTDSGSFHLKLRSGETLNCDRILLATGSSPQGHRLAKSLGHSLIPPVPSLFTFNIADPRLQKLAGIAVAPVRLRLQLDNNTTLEETGPLLITHWGVSGPAVLKLSAWGARDLKSCNYRAILQIHWLPQFNPETLRQTLQRCRQEFSRRAISNQCPLPLPRRLWQRLVARCNISPEQRWASLSKSGLNALIRELTQGSYQIVGKGVFKDEFVTCGGIPLPEVNFKTMESRRCPGLYFAGEVLDIDGITGGFNFQSAWTTGWIAGQSLAQN